jgi:hypothetical protein
MFKKLDSCLRRNDKINVGLFLPRRNDNHAIDGFGRLEVLAALLVGVVVGVREFVHAAAAGAESALAAQFFPYLAGEPGGGLYGVNAQRAAGEGAAAEA